MCDNINIYAFRSYKGYVHTIMVKIKKDWFWTPMRGLYNENFYKVKNHTDYQRKLCFLTWHNLTSSLASTARDFLDKPSTVENIALSIGQNSYKPGIEIIVVITVVSLVIVVVSIIRVIVVVLVN